MPKVLLFGSSGLLGNAIIKYLTDSGLEVYGVDCVDVKSNLRNFKVDVTDHSKFLQVIEDIAPSWVINCVVMKNKPASDQLATYFYLNTVFPQLLSYYSRKHDFRFIHFSTNGVFRSNGRSYTDKDTPNAESLYGISKALSEKVEGIVIRTSIIGHKKNDFSNLLDWFLANESDEVEGFSEVYWNGITTLTVAKIIRVIIMQDLFLRGKIINLTSPEIVTKYQLLCLFNEIFSRGKVIQKRDRPIQNITLVRSKEQDLHFSEVIASLSEQLVDLKEFYDLK